MRGRFWTKQEIVTLYEMAKTRATAKEMALHVGHTAIAVQIKLAKLKIKTAQSKISISDPIAFRRAVWDRRIAPRLFGRDGCEIWSGAKDGKGYGQISLEKKRILVHRISLELKIGRLLIDGECACHHCDVPACVNADHLFVGSPRDNTIDALRKGRMRGMFEPGHRNKTILRGEATHAAKLTETIVREIRKDYESGLGYRKLAKKYQIHRATARCVVKKTTWTHVE
jgi:hypothetical protein